MLGAEAGATRNRPSAIRILHLTTGVVVLLQSLQTVAAAVRPPHGGHRIPMLVLGSVETIAAVFFLVPRTLALGAIGLLAIFGVAFLLHAVRGQPPLPLLVYAASVWLVMSETGSPRPEAPDGAA